MKNSTPKKTSTQKFIEIEDVFENIVLFEGGKAAMAIEVTATNFALLSQDEQNAKIASYIAFLNSLSFPIQIFIRNKQLDISSYINLLQTQQDREPNPIVKERIRLYKDFVANLVKVNTVLDKRFYIVVYYSYLEKGVKKGNMDDFKANAKAALHTKAQGVQSQLTSLNLKNKALEHDELVSLFHEIYNPTAAATKGGIQ